uniref:ubiquitinyl hydrolase 1 n=1 Tax=Kalanchoe fedtschenkoi TaxID=63787 RepID=A0A7N0UPS3_KALFE
MLVPEFSYYINLGFWYLKLLVLLSFPVIGYVIRRKWRFALAKEAEIKRLMLLAAEEAARAEFEAAEVGYYASVSEPANRAPTFGFEVQGSFGSSAGSFVNAPEVSVRNQSPEAASSGVKVYQSAEAASVGVKVYQCAVCLSPTTTRCSRCKSVRYCSAKCQIFHWREGHKDECRSPIIVNQASDAENYSRFKAFNQEKEATRTGSVETEDKQLKLSRKHQEGNAFCSVGQGEKLQVKNDNTKAEILQEVKPSNSTSSFSTSFSSDSSFSSINSDSSDDTSTTESSGSIDLGKTNGCHQADTSDQSKCVPKRASEIKPCDVKGSATTPSKLTGTQSISSHHDAQRTSNSTPTLSVKDSDPSVAKLGASEFWEGALEYRWSEPVQTKSHATEVGLSNIGSSLRRASDLYGKNERNSHVDGKAPFSQSVTNEHSHESASSKKINLSSSEVRSCIQSSCKTLKHAKNADDNALNITKEKKVTYSSSAAVLSPHSGESKTDAQKVSNSALPSSKKAGHTLNGTGHTSKPRRSSASNGDGSIHNVKGDKFCQANDVSHSKNASGPSSFAERLGRALNSSEANCTVQSLKSRLFESLPSNSHGAHSTVNNEGKVTSNVAKVDKCYSLKAANGVKTSTWKADDFKVSKLSKRCGADERQGNKGLFSYEAFKTLYGWNKVELQPCGLVNCGNSCYANAVLQCLSFTPPLTAYLLQGLHSKTCNKRDWCFTCEFESLILKAKDGNSPISPIGIISKLPNIGSHLSNGREEDAHEFLRYVVDTMQAVCMNEARNKVSDTTEEDTTLVGLTFGGYLQSKIRCMKCGSKSERPERIMDLSVEIEGSIGSLKDALKRFTSTETLDADNKYNCARCKSYQKARKKLTVLEAPNILTIALKRFQAGKFGKLSKWIDFPEILDMAPFMSSASDDKAPVYKLYGVIVHLDTMNAAFSGHYVCYVKNIQNKWFKIDDSVVCSCLESSL